MTSLASRCFTATVSILSLKCYTPSGCPVTPRFPRPPPPMPGPKDGAEWEARSEVLAAALGARASLRWKTKGEPLQEAPGPERKSSPFTTSQPSPCPVGLRRHPGGTCLGNLSISGQGCLVNLSQSEGDVARDVNSCWAD